jgi:hypothetical protein
MTPFAPGEVRTIDGVEYVSVRLRDTKHASVRNLMRDNGLRESTCGACFEKMPGLCGRPSERACGTKSLHDFIVTVPIAGALLLAGLLEDSR